MRLMKIFPQLARNMLMRSRRQLTATKVVSNILTSLTKDSVLLRQIAVNNFYHWINLANQKQPVLIKYAQEFLLSLQSFSFTPTIDRPTRVHNSSATLFDNILTNKVDANITSGNIVSDISDHFSQFCVSHTFFKKLKSKKQKRRDFSGFSVNSFNSELSEALLNQNNFDDQFFVDIAFSNFYNTLSGLVEKHFSLKTLSKRKLKQFSKPWITIGLKKSIKVKNSLFQSGAKHIISGPLSNICNISVQEGVFPSNLKQAKVIPVYKSENETEPGNYRPISLLSIFNRIFEKLMYRQPKNFLNKHDILFKLRYRFREKHSTQHTVIDIVNIMQNNMDLKLFTCGIFLDLKKPLIPSIIQSYKKNLITMVSEASLTTGFLLTFLAVHKWLK